ncbi:MAG TPA: hypothetical protein VGK49_09525, partial [Ilumatobacteraceae bacterium]
MTTSTTRSAGAAAGATGLSPVNAAILRGTVSSAPRRRELPSGSVLDQLEITTRWGDAPAATVPVAWFEPTIELAADDEVVVIGSVRRRFFRAGGATASRTEVVADRVIRA